jgi:hypothetical protein
LWLQGELPLVAMLLLNGFAIYAAFTLLHDATHRTVSRSLWLNDLLGTIACFALPPGFATRIHRYLLAPRISGVLVDAPAMQSSPSTIASLLGRRISIRSSDDGRNRQHLRRITEERAAGAA